MSQPSSPCLFGMSETSLSKSWHLKSSFDTIITFDPIHMIGEPKIGSAAFCSQSALRPLKQPSSDLESWQLHLFGNWWENSPRFIGRFLDAHKNSLKTRGLIRGQHQAIESLECGQGADGFFFEWRRASGNLCRSGAHASVHACLCKGVVTRSCSTHSNETSLSD